MKSQTYPEESSSLFFFADNQSAFSGTCCVFLILLGISLFSGNTKAQEIDFGSYGSYSVTVIDISLENLHFGMLIKNEGLVSLPISEAKVLGIEGVKYLDVIVDITADEYLLLDGDPSCETEPSCRIPFTLQAAYANNGTNNVNQARLINVASNVATAQFPIMQRGNQPPGPPPTPMHEGYNPALYHETAYLYIYGSVNIGAIDAGNYSADITVTISYD